MNRAALLRQSALLLSEYLRLNHSTGRPLAWAITLSITQPGYHDSGFESMSFVPSATTTAVVCGVSREPSVEAPADAVRPTRASIVTLVHSPVDLIFVASEPNASDPTVSESPMNSSVPWPLVPMMPGDTRASTAAGPRVNPISDATTMRLAATRRGTGNTTSLWQG